MAKTKFSPEEIEAAGYFHGMLNLALWSEKEMISVVQKYADRPKVILHTFRGLVASMCESDEMFDGMNDEIREWVKRMKKGDDFCVQTWLGAKEGKTSQQVFKVKIGKGKK